MGYEKNLYSFFVNTNYHFGHFFNNVKNFDLYAGVNTGCISWYTDQGYTKKQLSPAADCQIGVRWYFKNGLHLILNSEENWNMQVAS